MKQLLLLLLSFCIVPVLKAQNAYIQVNGEPGLSVYLNGQFKGKTSAEYSGYIIQHVSAGKNLIRIEKPGFSPYEEYITVQSGEVFAYKVKPFSKHTVTISQEGNSGETEKKAAVRTGKLVVQSVPIEIKITIPEIEGVSNMVKTKDQWIADAIQEGSYTATFTFNDKAITKTIQIDGNNTTSVFVNMLSGEFTTKSTLDEKAAIQKGIDAQTVFVREFCNRYKFTPLQTMDEFLAQHPEARYLADKTESTDKSTFLKLGNRQLKKAQSYLPGYSEVFVASSDAKNRGKISSAQYTLVFTKDFSSAKAAYDKIENEFKTRASPRLLKLYPPKAHRYFATIFAWDNGMDLSVAMYYEDDWYHTYLIFSLN